MEQLQNKETNKVNFVFDMDDTIYDLMEPFKKCHEKLFAERVSIDCKELFLKSRIYSDIILDREKEGKIAKEDGFYERIRMTYEYAGLQISREDGARFEDAYRYYQTTIEPFDFMEKILDYCRKERIPIAVLTNGGSERQRRKADVLELQRWFEDDWIFPTGEIGFHKPHAGAFRAVEKRMNFCPEDTWYIGDTYRSDIVGAAEAGWNTIWLNHRESECPEAVSRATAEVRRGDELFTLLRKLHLRI